ncbi:MAG TPA: arsenate reductase ArsC [Burkholderiales bacterium]|nr:arsenate reductase ArsC [Burkholderiales bacterium]
MLNVLFLDSGNTCHSLIAESVLRASARGRFHAYSAGCVSTGAVSPDVIAFLRERSLPVEGLRSKGLRELMAPEAPSFAFVITLSGIAAETVSERALPHDPVVAHWHLDADDEGERSTPSVWAMRDAFWILSRRIKIFTSLPHGKASRHVLENRLHAL